VNKKTDGGILKNLKVGRDTHKQVKALSASTGENIQTIVERAIAREAGVKERSPFETLTPEQREMVVGLVEVLSQPINHRLHKALIDGIKALVELSKLGEKP
jgi:hypothetical protein